MPILSEEMAITSEGMGISSEEIGIIGEVITLIFGRNDYYWGRNSGDENCRACGLNVDGNRWRWSVVVLRGEVGKSLLYRGGDVARQ